MPRWAVTEEQKPPSPVWAPYRCSGLQESKESSESGMLVPGPSPLPLVDNEIPEITQLSLILAPPRDLLLSSFDSCYSWL